MVGKYVQEQRVSLSTLRHAVHNAFRLENNCIPSKNNLASRWKPESRTNQVFGLVIPCHLSETPSLRRGMDVEVPVRILWGTAFWAIAPFDLLEARTNLGEESFPFVGKLGIRVNDTLVGPLRLPFVLHSERPKVVVQKGKERSCVVRIKITINVLA